MLTPAEEMGLSGMNLAGRVRRALHKIPEPELFGLLQRIEREAALRHLAYLRDGRPDPIRVMALPLTVLPDQRLLRPFRRADPPERPQANTGPLFSGFRPS